MLVSPLPFITPLLLIGVPLLLLVKSRRRNPWSWMRCSHSGWWSRAAAAFSDRSAGEWAACLEGAAGLVNRVGRTVDCVKTPDHC